MKNNNYIWPIEPIYKVAEHDKYGIRKNHYTMFKERPHCGFDITIDIGTEVKAIADGEVLLAEFDGTTSEGLDAFNQGYGNKIEIVNEDGNRVVYAHLRKIMVKPGQKVKQGEIIGLSGSSGGSRVPHLHIEIRRGNTDDSGLKNTYDPLELLPKRELEKLEKEFVYEPYYGLWKIMASDKPWSFKKEDIPYSEDKKYIS